MRTLSRLIRLEGKRYYLMSKLFASTKEAFGFEIYPSCETNFPSPVLNFDYYCNPVNKLEIEENIKSRKSRGDIDLVLNIHKQLAKLNEENSDFLKLKNKLLLEICKMPNKLHKSVKTIPDKPRIVNNIGIKREFSFKPREFSEISKALRIARSENLSNFTDHRSYFFMGQLAEMEYALVQYSLKYLFSRKFQLISVPDILDKRIIESCGMNTEGDRTQVYSLDADMYGKGLCLSGTSEMAIARFLMNKTFIQDQLPLRFAAVSRCYRAEISRTAEERGIYRVHHFTKVEMFGVSLPDKSDELLEEFRKIEESLFETLGLHCQTLDMPPAELGDQASRKYDVEAWMPGRKIFGEISSCSTCTDYQSRRLNIKIGDSFAHTLNGTACAIPRLLIAIVETNQNKDGSVNIPTVLQPFMRGETQIKINRKVPKMKPFRLNK